jgi:hypothetical protein
MDNYQLVQDNMKVSHNGARPKLPYSHTPILAVGNQERK